MSQIDTRLEIINAAEQIVKNQGLSKLTISHVATVAGVSKGGVLYHFPSKDALVQGMLEYALEVFNKNIEEHKTHDHEPGAWARGYIESTFKPTNELLQTESASASALMAIAGLNPSLLEPYLSQQKTWIPSLVQDGLDPKTAVLIRLAVDGLWLNEALGITPLSKSERDSFVEHLLSMTRDKPRDS